MLPDEEMSLWLEYPLDDSLETTYCSDIFGDLVYPNIQLLRDSFTHKQNTAPQDGHACEADAQKNADVAMALGVRRAVGLLSHPGAEAFDKVRTSMQPIASKSAHSKTLEVDLSSNFNNSQALDVAPIQPAKAGPLDLLDFARPGAQTQENLLNSAHNKPSNIEGVKQQLGKTGTEDLASQESSFAGSTTTVVSEIGPCKGINLQHKQQSESIYRVTDGHLVSSPCQSHSADVFNGKNVEFDACWHQSAADSTVTAVERGAEVLGITELTNLSPSRGSGNSTDKSEKEGSMAVCKRKASQGDEPDEHENFEASTGQKSSGHSNAAKRNRAAEIHNLSERRRRERINEKMRALQELIPNSNKTDKASMLDEAIEYLKLLQSQIQMMSMKTGIGIPTMMMPMGMHHLQTQQILAVPHGGVGFGMEMGIPEIGIPAGGRHVVPIEGVSQQARALHTMDAACFQPSSSSLSNTKLQNYFQIPGLPTWGVVEPCMALQSHQQLQPVPLNMHMNMGPHTPFLQQHQQIRRHQLPKMNREDKSNH